MSKRARHGGSSVSLPVRRSKPRHARHRALKAPALGTGLPVFLACVFGALALALAFGHPGHAASSDTAGRTPTRYTHAVSRLLSGLETRLDSFTPPPTTTTTTTTAPQPQMTVPEPPPAQNDEAPTAAAGSWESLVMSLPWDGDLMMRVVHCESGGDPDAYNPSGAVGLFQVLGGSFDPIENVREAYAKWQRSGMRPWAASERCWDG